MIELKMFSTRKDLSKLTGLSEDDLWDHFNLDDWDVGFCSDVPLTKMESDEDCGDFEEPVKDAVWLVMRMNSYCIGYEHVEYNGKHYYLVYHS